MRTGITAAARCDPRLGSLIQPISPRVFMRVLMITCEWQFAPFVVRQIAFLRKAGVEVDVFSFQGERNPLNYLRAWWQVQRRLRTERYDVVHAQWGQSAPT